jgi:hypothetical protein
MVVVRGYLGGGEGVAHGADGLGVLVRLLLDLQQLGGLDDGLQRGRRLALLQVVGPQPLLHLADVVPGDRGRGTYD